MFFSNNAESLVFFKQITDSREYLEDILLIIISYIITFINGYRQSLIKSKVKGNELTLSKTLSHLLK